MISPFTLLVIAFVLAVGFIASPYEIIFEEDDDIEW